MGCKSVKTPGGISSPPTPAPQPSPECHSTSPTLTPRCDGEPCARLGQQHNRILELACASSSKQNYFRLCRWTGHEQPPDSNDAGRTGMAALMRMSARM